MHVTSSVTIDSPSHQEDRMWVWNLARQMPKIALASWNCFSSEALEVRTSPCGILCQDSSTPCFPVKTQRSPEPDAQVFRPPEIVESQACVAPSESGSNLVQVFPDRIFSSKADQVTSDSLKVSAKAVSYYCQEERNSKAASSNCTWHSRTPQEGTSHADDTLSAEFVSLSQPSVMIFNVN
jgi:hypothetical protein